MRYNVSITVIIPDLPPKKEFYAIEAENEYSVKVSIARKYREISHVINYIRPSITAIGGTK